MKNDKNKSKQLIIPNKNMLIFVCASILGAYLFHLILLIIHPQGPELNLYFGRLQDFLADYTNVANYSANLDTYTNPLGGAQEHAYPPLTYALMYLVSRFTPNDAVIDKNIWRYEPIMLTFLIVTIVICAVFFWVVSEAKTGSRAEKFFVALSVLLSAEFLFSIERGNTIIVTVLLLMLFVYLYDNENKYLRELALMALAAAFSLKITPAVAGILLVKDKRYKDIVKLSVYALILFFGPFLFMKGGFSNLLPFVENIRLNTEAYKNNLSCGLAGSFYIVSQLFSDDYVQSDFATVSKFITYFFSAILLIGIFTDKSKSRNVLSIVLLIMMVPSHSGSYNLLYLVPFFVLFLNENHYRILGFLTAIMLLIVFGASETIFPLFLKILCLGIFFVSYSIYILSERMIKPSLQKRTNTSMNAS